jgi:hypothetical protein
MKLFLLVFTTFFGLLSVFGQQSSFTGYSVDPNNAASVIEFNLGEYHLQTIDLNGTV